MSTKIDCPDCAGSGKCPGCHRLPGMGHDPTTCEVCKAHAEFLRDAGVGTFAEGFCPHGCVGGMCRTCGGTGHVYD